MKRIVLALVVHLIAAGVACAADDVLLADFEAGTYGAWKAEGEAFGPGPARGTLPNQMEVSGFLGKGLVNTFFNGDRTTGRLTSPAFKVERKFINFLIGGGMDEKRTCINLLLEGKVVRTATGPNDRPGGSERLDWHSWDVSDLAGKTVVIEIVDQATGGWGHINVDHIVQSDAKKAATTLRDATRTLALDQRYLLFPVKNKAPKRRLAVLIDDKVVREFEIELAEAEPDFWTFLDVAAFKGRQATLRVDRLPETSKGLAAIEQGDAIKSSQPLYREELRPQFHFSSRRGWLNDPNGLVFLDGEYHLYYQHNPYGWDWGNMHWGHAASKDLVHWEELPIAIYPRQFGDWAFSGSAVVDRDNTAGFKKDPAGPDVIVAAWTSTGRGECISYSLDRGRTFVEFEGNPVVKHTGRDPKLIWYAPGRHWVMAVYTEPGRDKRGIDFHTSTDLKKWEKRSYLDGYFECPEIFELPVDRDASKKKWVVFAADGAYAIGSFDGKTFTPDHPGKHPGSFGDAFYAAQTFSDLPPSDGRRIRVGWGRAPSPGMPFNQMMNFPVEVTLRTTEQGPRLFALPVREIEKLHGKMQAVPARDLRPGEDALAGITGELLDVRLELEVGTAEEVTLALRGTPITYRAQTQVLEARGRRAPLAPVEGRIRLRALVDRTSIELFANDGRVYMPLAVISKADDRSLSLTCAGGPARIRTLEVVELRSIWP